MKLLKFLILSIVLTANFSESRVVRLVIKTRELVLSGKTFGSAGPYESLSGTVKFASNPELPANNAIVDLELAPRNERNEVEFSADFFLIKPVEPKRGNGVLFYEAGNRGRKRILSTFQNAKPSSNPKSVDEFGDGSLMSQGFSLLWMGWQWDVPEGRMRMKMPIASNNGTPLQGLVRGNIILGERTNKAVVADRGHQAYLPITAFQNSNFMTVRNLPNDKPEIILADRWRFLGAGTVELDGGFEPGRIYDVVYRSQQPKVIGVGLGGTRDLVSFLKYESSNRNPLVGIQYAIGWGVSQTGRFLRHFLYQGFNADEEDRIVFDGIIAQVGGAGRGSFNHRFGQASRDALQHFNIHFPVDMFPFSDGLETDIETGERDSLLKKARQTNTVPKLFHILTNSEYFNRGGSLVHTDPTGSRDSLIPNTSRIYSIASAPHIVGKFPPRPNPNASFLGQAPMNPLGYNPIVRALFDSMVKWLISGTLPPESAYPQISDATLTKPENAGWPMIPGYDLPRSPMTPHRLNFGPKWSKGIVTNSPPKVGKPYVILVPAVDNNGNDISGIRLPEIEVPLATHTGWNYRHPNIGSSDRLASEIGAYLPFPTTKRERQAMQDPRMSIEERYSSKNIYIDQIIKVASELVKNRYLLKNDVAAIIKSAERHYDWATSHQ